MSMLEVKDLEVYYGVIQAIKGISFHVEEGEVIALIGANGTLDRIYGNGTRSGRKTCICTVVRVRELKTRSLYQKK